MQHAQVQNFLLVVRYIGEHTLCMHDVSRVANIVYMASASSPAPARAGVTSRPGNRRAPGTRYLHHRW